jgi:predicted Zn-dependent protease with MMP-like domain
MAAEAVARAQRELPREVLEAAMEVRVILEGSPGPDVLAEGFEPDLLGLFAGRTVGDPGDPEPPRIHLYTANLWHCVGGDVEAFREESRLTYLHELGHYLGWGEDQVAARGLD